MGGRGGGAPASDPFAATFSRGEVEAEAATASFRPRGAGCEQIVQGIDVGGDPGHQSAHRIVV